MNSQKQPLKIHWRAPTTIIIALFAASAFAIGHHAFYISLNKQPVDQDDRLFTQQINLAIGTGFAFLFRASLVIAVGASYWQVFWGTLLRKQKPMAVSHVNTLAGALGSLFDFFNARAMLRNPNLAALALLSWLVPLAALLPPATLSVENVQHLYHDMIAIPTVNFSSSGMNIRNGHYLKAANGSFLLDENDHRVMADAMDGSPVKLCKMASVAALQSRIQDFPSIGANKSYQSQIPGSAVRCKRISGIALDRFNVYLGRGCEHDHIEDHGHHRSHCVLPKSLSYYLWSPNNTSWMPQGNVTALQDHASSLVLNKFGFPHMLIATSSPVLGRQTWIMQGWHVLNCSLFYATYHTTITSTRDHSTVSSYTIDIHDQALPQGDVQLQLNPSVPSSSKPNATDYGHLGLLGCLRDLLGGSVLDGGLGNSDISKTALMFSNELLYYTVVRPENDPLNASGITGVSDPRVFNWTTKHFTEEAYTATTFHRPLAFAIEQLYQNLTLSLLSRAAWLETPGQMANVTTETWFNEYTYHQRNLLLSYGIALALSLIACSYGCSSIYRNGVSYSNNFSTVLRTTKGHLEGFNALLTTADSTGMDPLPRHLAKAQLTLGRDNATEHSLDGARDEDPSAMELQQQRIPMIVDRQSVVTDRSENESLWSGVDHLGLPMDEASSEFTRESYEEFQRRSSVGYELNVDISRL